MDPSFRWDDDHDDYDDSDGEGLPESSPTPHKKPANRFAGFRACVARTATADEEAVAARDNGTGDVSGVWRRRFV